MLDIIVIQLRRWFQEMNWKRWDRESHEDARAGRLDFLRQEALSAKRNGTLKDL